MVEMSANTVDVSEGMLKTTYLVSGHPRSGTSMLMQALASGGLEPAHSPALDAAATSPDGYEQNPAGFFELSLREQQHPWFPARHWGKLIKVGFPQLSGLAPGKYVALFMMRHPEEIRMSHRALGKKAARLWWDTDEEYLTLMKRYLAAAALRLDMQVLEVWYSDILSDPRKSFERIRQFGVPIDPVAAAACIKPEYYRHRAEASDEP